MRFMKPVDCPNACNFKALILALTLSVTLAAVVLFLGAGAVFGQMTTGTILGIVTDPSGAVIPGARVTITNLATGISTSFVTGNDGSYVVPYLIPGRYSASARVPDKGKSSARTRLSACH